MNPRVIRAVRRAQRNTDGAEQRGMRAFWWACITHGVRPSDVSGLRGVESRRFHASWTAEMRRLAIVEGAWNPEWDQKRGRINTEVSDDDRH